MITDNNYNNQWGVTNKSKTFIERLYHEWSWTLRRKKKQASQFQISIEK